MTYLIPLMASGIPLAASDFFFAQTTTSNMKYKKIFFLKKKKFSFCIVSPRAYSKWSKINFFLYLFFTFLVCRFVSCGHVRKLPHFPIPLPFPSRLPRFLTQTFFPLCFYLLPSLSLSHLHHHHLAFPLFFLMGKEGKISLDPRRWTKRDPPIPWAKRRGPGPDQNLA